MRLLAVMACSMAIVPCVMTVMACAGRDEKQVLAEERASLRRERRAYDGAPPVIPHAIESLQREECLACHLQGLDVPGEGLAPRTPHHQMANCQQCHVEQMLEAEALVSNRFVGWRGAPHGMRAYAGAPPTIPHPLAMRRDCLACHDEKGGSPIRTPHADRVNCLQCHAILAEHQTAEPVLWRASTFVGAR